jgi:hypothetical protein
MKQEHQKTDRDERRKTRAVRKIFLGWLETARGKRWLNSTNPGTPVVNMDTGGVTVRRGPKA